MGEKMSRRKFIKLAAGVGAGAAALACGPVLTLLTATPTTLKGVATGAPLPRSSDFPTPTPPGPEASPTPSINKKVPSPYLAAGLYIGTYGESGGKPITEGAISANQFNAAGHRQNGYSNVPFGNGESRSVTLYLDEKGKETIPAAMMVSQEWLDTSFQAKTIGARTTGSLPNGKQVEKEGTSWYLLDEKGKRTGETFVTVIPNRKTPGSKFGWPMLVMKGQELYVGLVDAVGNLLDGEDFRPAFQKPKDIAQNQAQYKGDTSKLVALNLDYDGKMRLRDLQNRVVDTIKYIGEADTMFGKWVTENIKTTGFDTQLKSVQKEYATLTGRDATTLTPDFQIKLDGEGRPHAHIVDKGIDGDTPLMITDMEKGEWRAPGYQEVAPSGFDVGSEFNSWTGPNLTNKGYVETFINNFNIGTPGGILADSFFTKIPQNKKLTPEEVIQAYDWGPFNEVMKFMSDSKKPATIMHIFPGYNFTHANAPKWMREMSDQELSRWIVKHTETIASRLEEAGINPKVISVINELAWHAKDRNAYDQVWLEGDYLYSRLREEYVKKAFETARKLWPKAVLLLNDDQATEGTQTNTPLNAEAQVEFELVKRMRSAGVPIDGFGYQGHLLARNFIEGGGTTEQNIEANIASYKKQLAALMNLYDGIKAKFNITELDVNVGGLPTNWTQQQKEALKARLFTTVFEVALNSKNCNSITTWGFSNASSWVLQGGGYPYGPGESPLPFDRNFKPTQAVYEIRKVLYSHQDKK